MLKCHMLEESVGSALGPRPRIKGFEAVLVGATIGLRHDDHIAASRYKLMVDVVRGASLDQLLGHEKGRGRNHANRNHNDRVKAITPATEFSIATGVALDFRRHKRHSVVIALSLADAGSPDFWHEPAIYAATHKLPVIFVVQRKFTKRKHNENSRAADLSSQADKHGLPGIPVDANDAVAVYRVAHEAIDRARRGAGPALIECKAWPFGAEDSLAHMRRYLQWKGFWTDDWGRHTAEQIRREIDHARHRTQSR
ncbi:MAG: hypothetical protein JOY79_05915 [Acidobacteriaceae bacterium]|nr:hypothetical protein [Acidobacteriaceae bacterium]